MVDREGCRKTEQEDHIAAPTDTFLAEDPNVSFGGRITESH